MIKGQDEATVLKQCLEYLQIKGIYAWRNNTGATKAGNRMIRFGKTGSSDILGITKDGRFLAVECKRQYGGIVSEAQERFLFNITQNGGVAIVVNSLESLIEKLKENKVI